MISKFQTAYLEQICNILGATDTGLSGSEIGRLLGELNVVDPDPANTKRIRLFNALSERQDQDGVGNIVGAFIERTMNPVRFHTNRDYFESELDKLNTVLAFCGLELGHDGKLRSRTSARTLSEAESRAAKLKNEMLRRGVHSDVLRFCQAELVQDNYFHAVFEATKSVAEKIRAKSGLTSDGAKLVDDAFGSSARLPVLAFNTLRTETERMEHTGLMNLMKGMFGAFRNVTAHAPKITWSIEESDALDLLTLASLIHRRLDNAVRTIPGS